MTKPAGLSEAARAGNEPPDDELMRRAAGPDGRVAGDAFAVLMCRHRRIAFTFAVKYLGNPADAEDLVQEAFVRLWRRRRSYRPGNLRAYLFTTVVNLCHNHRKSWWSRLWSRSKASTTADVLCASPDGPGDPVLAKTVNSALFSLDKMDRTTLILAEVIGMTGPEIGALLNVKPQTVRVHLMRARADLRQRLGSQGVLP